MQSIREAGKRRRRIAVVEAATGLVTEGGTSALTMRSLSEQAGVSVPTIYNLIGGRDEVLAAVLSQRADELAASFDRLPRDPIRRCLVIVDRWIDHLIARRVLIHSALRSGEALSLRRHDAVTAAAVAAVADSLAGAQRQGMLTDDADPVRLARRLAGMASQALVDWATDHGDDTSMRLEVRYSALVVLLAGCEGDRRSDLARRLRSTQRALERRERGRTP